ncbi:MAG: hypothetical protein ABII72_04390 [Parcubacteria group bacterium]
MVAGQKRGKEMDLALLEILINAHINLKNTVKLLPTLKDFPIFQVALAQLDSAINQLEKELERD